MEIAVSTTPAHVMLTRKKNTWYSVRDGNWNDPNTWMSNALDKRAVTIPRTGDDVYILHNVLQNVNTTVNNLYVQGKLTSANTSLTLSVNGDLQASGTIDLTGSNTNLLLYGYNNFINSFTAGNSTVTYTRNGDQNVMDLGYKNLTIYGVGIKYLISNLTINGNLNVNDYRPENSVLECGAHNLIVNGNTFITTSGIGFSKSGVGNLIFIGLLTINANTIFSSSITNIELRGGSNLWSFGGAMIFNCPVNFTTNSQTISHNGAIYNAAITIIGAITVTNTTGGTIINGGIDGTDAGSTYNNNGVTWLGLNDTPMSTGVFNYMNTSTSTLGYTFNGDYTLPYTSYAGLVIEGTGTKTLKGNTTIEYNIAGNNLGEGSKLDCLTYDLTIMGTTFWGGLGGILSTSGTLIFGGFVTFNNSNMSYSSETTLEFRGGFTMFPNGSTITIGSPINFTTNSQTISGTHDIIFTGNTTISGGITVNFGGIGTTSCPVFSGAINGSSSSDIFNNIGTINYQNMAAPMTIGKLYCNQVANTFIYGLSGDQDIQIPSDPTSGYKNLTLQGSGAKKLLGSLSVKGNYTLVAPATLNSNGYTLTNP